MRLRSVCAWMALCLFTGELAPGQEASATTGEAVGAEKESVLPPVIVRPGPQSPPEASGGGSEATAGATGNLIGYPSLSAQIIGQGDGVGLDSVIRGEKPLFDIPAFATIVDRQTISEKQSQDMFRALQNEVGVLMQRTATGHSSPFVRGLTGQQVLMLVDGVRINNGVFRSGPNQYFNLIDPGQVERIEVVRGPESVLWGSDALGGVINVVTRSASQDRGSYTGGGFVEYFSTADTASYSRANVEGWVGRSGVFGGASYLNVNELRTGGDLGYQPFTNYDQYAGDVKFNYLLDNDSMMTVALQHFEQEDVPRSDRFAPFTYGPPSADPRPQWFDPQQRDLAYLRWQGVAGNGLFDAYSVTFSYAFNKEGSREIRSTTRTDIAEFDVDTYGFTLALTRDLDWMGRLTYGADLYHDEVAGFRDQVDPGTGAVTPDNPQFPDGSHYRRTGAFINWDVDVTQRIAATAGVRYENDDAGGTLNQVVGTPVPFTRDYHDWIASVGLLYKAADWFHVFGTVAEGYRAPNLDDLTVDRSAFGGSQEIPSLGVEPEHAWTYEVGFKFDAPRLRLQVSQYWTDLQDNILRQAVDADGNPVPNVVGPYGTLIPGSSTFIRANFDSYLYGTELAGEYLLRDDWWLYGNFWYTFGQNLEADEPLGRIPPAQGILGLRWRDANRRKWFDTYVWLASRQDRYSAANNIDPRYILGGTPAYATLNLRMGTTLGSFDKHRLSLGLENITDTAYRVIGSGVDGPGFNAIFGYEWVH